MTYTDPTATPYDRDDIVEADDLARPSPEPASFEGDVHEEVVAVQPDAGVETPRSVRAALREDARRGLDWADMKVKSARERIREKPEKALLYGLGLGLIVGLYLRR